MVFKLGMEAQKTLAPAQRPRIGHKSVIAVKFVDREEQIEQAA